MNVHDGLASLLSSTASSVAVSRLVGTLQPNGLLRDELAAHLVSDVYYRATVDAMQSLAKTNTVQFYPPTTATQNSDVADVGTSRQQDAGKEDPASGEQTAPPPPPSAPACDLICLRTRFIDDELTELLQELASNFPGHGLQVVLLGAGMDSRPWRLHNLPPHISWFELDMPDVVHAKITRVTDAGAQLSHTDEEALQHAFAALRGGNRAHPDGGASSSPSSPSASPSSAPHPTSSTQQPPYTFPLLVDAWHAVDVDLRQGDVWVEELLEHGFDQHVPTVWVAEGLLYYLQEHEAVSILSHAAHATAPGIPAALIATHMNTAMLNNWTAMAAHEPAYEAATTFAHAMEDACPHAVLEGTPWQHVRTMTQGGMAAEYGVALVRSAADTRYAAEHGSSCYYVIEAVLREEQEGETKGEQQEEETKGEEKEEETKGEKRQ